MAEEKRIRSKIFVIFSRLFLSFLIILPTLCGAYPIQELKDQIEAGNITYVEKYLADLSEREFSQPDMQFLRALLDIHSEPLNQIIQQLNVDDLSGHLAPIYHLKKAEFAIYDENFNAAISDLKHILFRYSSSNYIQPASTLLLNCYQKLGHADSAAFYMDWIGNEVPDAMTVKQITTTAILPKQTEQSNTEKPFTIQVGAFGQRANAENRVNKLNAAGFQARIEVIEKNNKDLFAVRVGHFEVQKDANKVKSQIRKKLKLTSIIKRLDR